MKILLISMPSIHVVRWVENINKTQYELYWFDVLDRGVLQTDLIPSSNQFSNWKKRKYKYIKGEYFLSKKAPSIYNKIQPFLEVTAQEKLVDIIREIKPDIVHSFEMQNCSYPILKVMNNFSKLKWIYSCWGSDLYHYGEYKAHRKKIINVLNRIDYLITDCKRDFKLANKYGFNNKYLGVIYGGGGFNLEKLLPLKLDLKDRDIILVKGYEHQFGRALNVIKALHSLLNHLKGFSIEVFGTHQVVEDYIKNNKLPFKVYGRHNLRHKELLEKLGQSICYIGNSVSDGMPNTLLEAIVMGAFPIQSNPGNATKDIIEHNVNGLLISNPNNLDEIKQHILKVITDKSLLTKSYVENTIKAKKNMDYNIVRNKINHAYAQIILDIKSASN